VPLPTLEELAAALQGARDELKGLSEAFQKGAGGVPGPDFSPLDRILHQAHGALRPRLQARIAQAAGQRAEPVATLAEAAPAGAPAAPAPEPSAGISGTIRNRDDVLTLLDKIIGYYERNEPSSPLPLLLQRC